MSSAHKVLLVTLLAVPVLLVLSQEAILDHVFLAVDWLRGQGPLGALLFSVGYFVAGMIALPLFPLTVIAGLVYGFGVGFVLLCPAAAAAAVLAGGLGGAWFRAPVLRFVRERPTVRAVFGALSDKGVRAVVLNRMAPVLPFALQNYALGAIGVRWQAMLVGTLVGMQPVIWAALYLGVIVGDLNAARAAIADGGGHLRLGLSFAGLAALVVLVVWLGRVARKARGTGA